MKRISTMVRTGAAVSASTTDGDDDEKHQRTPCRCVPPDRPAHTSCASKTMYKEGYAVFFRTSHTPLFIS